MASGLSYSNVREPSQSVLSIVESHFLKLQGISQTTSQQADVSSMLTSNNRDSVVLDPEGKEQT